MSSTAAPAADQLRIEPLLVRSQATAMGKTSQRRIDFVLKRKRDDDRNEVEEDPPAPATDRLPLLELEQQQHSHDEGQSNEPVTFRGIEFLQRDPGLRPQIVAQPIDIPDFEDTYILRGGRARHQPDQLTKEHYFRVEIFRATLDTQLFELYRRFNEKVMDLLSTSATLIPRNIEGDILETYTYEDVIADFRSKKDRNADL